MAAFFLALANPVEFKTSIPKSGSTITSWDFELQFDITKALEAAAVDKPGVAVGLGVYSNNDDQITILYKGDPENNNILGTAFTSTINGKSDKFVVNGNTLKMSFNSDIPIEKGQKYTVVIKNDMALYIKDKATRVSSTLLRNSSNPIVLEFYGDDLNDSQLFVESCSLEDNENLESISEILLHFNSAFKISDGANVLIREGEKDLSSTTLLSVSPDNEKQLKVSFAEPVMLYTGRLYTIQLPAGVLQHKDNPNVSNRLFEINISGTKLFSYSIIDYTPKEDQKLLPEKASITFDVPEGKTLVYTGNSVPFSGYSSCQIYPEGKENEATTLYAMTNKQQVTRNSFTWDLSDIAFIPSTKYYIKKEQGSTSLFDTSGNHCPEYRNEGITFSWTTPSVEELNLPVITKACYGSAKLGKHDDSSVPEFKDGGSYGYIKTIEMKVNKGSYGYDGKTYNAGTKDGLSWKLYDVTSGSRVFIKDIICGGEVRESPYEYYGVAQLWVNTTFYQGHTYEISLEENGLTPDSSFPTNLRNYIRSEEIVYKIVGSAPSSVELVSKNISDNENVDALYMAVWIFNGDFDLREGATVGYTAELKNSTPVTYQFPLNVEHLSGRTYVSANFMSNYYGTPLTFTEPTKCKLTLPESILYYATDETIVNKQIVTSFNGVVKSASVQAVDVSLEINGIHTTYHKAIKGEPYTFTLNHDSNWVVESVTHNSAPLSAIDGKYSTEPLTLANNDIKANLKFAVEALVDGTTGVAELPDSNIAVTTDSDKHIVISGLVGNENLAIYSMNGLLVKDFAADGKNIYHVSVDSGIYIVRVIDAYGNRKAAKVQVK